jgi:hypothetical protein
MKIGEWADGESLRGQKPATGLDGLGDLAGTQAPRAHANVLAQTADHHVHPLKIGALDALGLDVRVADSVRHLALLTANFTLRWHGFSEGG